MTPGLLTIRVPGVPAPGGSKRAFVYKGRDGRHRASVTDAAGEKNKNWRGAVATFAVQAMQRQGFVLIPRPVAIACRMTFYMPRPKGHYRAGSRADELKPAAPVFPVTKPDALKLARSTEDALTGVAWEDDCQVVGGPCPLKLYAGKERWTGAVIEIERVDDVVGLASVGDFARVSACPAEQGSGAGLWKGDVT